MILALLLTACADPPTPLSPAAPIWVEARKVDDGKPVRVHAPADTVMPSVEGLLVERASSGDDGTAVWEVSGKAGSYILEVPGPAGPVPVYVDIGVDGPTGGTMADLATPPARPPPVWPYVLAGVVGLGTLIAAGLAAWKRWRPIPPTAPPEPPDVIAVREWRALRAQTELDPAELALQLSAVYRRFLDATRIWPATARTTREILDNLGAELTASELECARRLLSAMDLVKFADRGDPSRTALADLFEKLDADFRRLVSPQSGGRPGPAAGSADV
ncbi:MAG: hypothetical protein EXR69_06040 [Myxococcales bacterium]|nr:hypothetical protein [Myxococcales bacterium]